MIKKTEKTEEKKICGKTIKEIRKAFFKNELGKLLAKIQIEKDIEKEDLKELNDYLETLKSKNDEIVNEAIRLFGGEVVGVKLDTKPPTVEELRGGASDKEWRERADKAMEWMQKTMNGIRAKISKREKIAGTFWLDTAITFLSYQDLIDKDVVYKNQLYHNKIIEIMNKYHLTRKASEDFAKSTIEYTAYKNASYFKSRIEEFILLCKKYDAHNEEV